MAKKKVSSPQYPKIIPAIGVPTDVENALKEKAKQDGVAVPVIRRKAYVSYLKSKGLLEEDKQYL